MDLKSLLKKLRYMDKGLAQIINLPEELVAISESINAPSDGETVDLYDFSMLFVKDHKELLLYFLETIECSKHDSVFWLVYPKKSGNIVSDLNRDNIWQTIKQYGYRPVSMVSINETWSAIRVRPISEVK